jgi:hypothetical protein
VNPSTAPTPTLAPLVRKWLAEFSPRVIDINQHFAEYLHHAHQVLGPSSSTDLDYPTDHIFEPVESYCNKGGHVIWLGLREELPFISERLILTAAKMAHHMPGQSLVIDLGTRMKLLTAREKVTKMWFDFCALDDANDDVVVQDFLSSVASFHPTLIVISNAVLAELEHPLDQLIRDTLRQSIQAKLIQANPNSTLVYLR